MKKLPISIMSGLILASMSFAVAEEAAKPCEKECKTVAKSECDACPIAKAMEALPKMSYIIAEEASTCSKSASTAAEAGKEVKYVVAGKELCCPTTAKDNHIQSVETFVSTFASTHTCDASSKTYVGNKGYDCNQHASTVAKKAMDGVKTVHLVGDEEICCPNAASEAAEKKGTTLTYVVAEEKTQCAKTNRMNLAVAKHKAAIQAIAQAEAPAEASQS